MLLNRPVARSFLSFGAVIVIVSVTIDPFIQLTVGKQNRILYVEDSSAQISYAKRYSKVQGADGNTYASTHVDANFALKSAVFYGVSQPDTLVSQQIRRSCPSDNCTWEPFQSLAICSTCADLSENGGVEQANLTEYRLPNGLILNNPDDSDLLLMTGLGTSDQSQSLSFINRDTLIWSMALMKVDNDTSPPVTAVESGLWYCVNEYNSSVENGDLSEVFTTISANDFNVSQAAVYSISEFMSATFTQTTNVNGTKKGMQINAFATNLSGIAYGPTVMEVLYQSKDLSATFAALAKSTTNTIRENSDGGLIAAGKAGISHTLIQVH
ncbi:hypothetical protein ACLMJK_005804 [Lecanora helva]